MLMLLLTVQPRHTSCWKTIKPMYIYLNINEPQSTALKNSPLTGYSCVILQILVWISRMKWEGNGVYFGLVQKPRPFALFFLEHTCSF